jgi:glycosyltransferase involved in cell wall biosynthesis
MKLYYWSPFFSNVATEKAVLNSIKSVVKFSKKKISPYLLDVIGEWEQHKKNLVNSNVEILDLLNFKIVKFLPKYGFLKSRFSYIIVFFFSIFNLHRTLKKEKPDYLIIHLMTFIPLLLLLFFNYETKFILRVSGYPKLNYLRSLFWRIVGKKIYLVTSPTKSTFDLLIGSKIFEAKKLRYLPEPILNFDEIKKKRFKRNMEPKKITPENYLISIGRLTRQKNYQFLIKAFNELNKEYPKLHLIILGEGEERQKLEKMIKKFDLQEKIFLIGYKENIYEYLDKAKIFILSSLWEDPGFVLVEAGYSNKIILSSDCPNGPKELLDNGKNGFLFKKNSMSDFLNKFREIQNLKEDIIFQKKLSFKKKMKEFTLLNHYKILSSIILNNEN